jgi:3-oxoacyl-[acyl-carrier protein] reductase
MTTNLSGKVALVTGASKGIGAGIARELARRGASVAVNYSRDKGAADKVVAEIAGAGGKAIAVKGNVADAASVKELVAAVASQLGPIDVLVNSAGIYEFVPIETFSAEHFYKLFNVNVVGMMQMIQAALERFNPDGGSIINVGSNISKSVGPHNTVYAATKSSMDVITRGLAKGLAARKIRVNVLSPGMVDTDGARAIGAIGGEWHKTVEKATPLGRIGQPADIGRVAAFLASEDSGWVTGQIVQVDGGFMA